MHLAFSHFKCFFLLFILSSNPNYGPINIKILPIHDIFKMYLSTHFEVTIPIFIGMSKFRLFNKNNMLAG